MCVYTYTHARARDQIQQSRVKLIQVGEIRFQSGLESIDCYSISGVCWQRVPDNRVRMREGTITFRLVFIEFLGDGYVSALERRDPKRRIETTDVREIKRSGGGGGVTESEQRQAILYEMRALTGNQWS